MHSYFKTWNVSRSAGADSVECVWMSHVRTQAKRGLIPTKGEPLFWLIYMEHKSKQKTN